MFIIDDKIDKQIISEYYNKISKHYDIHINHGADPLEWYPARNIVLSNNDKLITIVKDLLESYLRVELTLNFAELQTWPIGSKANLHTHEYRPREDYNSLLYLNNNFTGGNFYTDNLQIEPVEGRLTFFDGRVVPHGVKKVFDNHRHTAIFWWKNTNFK